MSSEDYKKINVGKHSVGIIGLNAALSAIQSDMPEASDERISTELLLRLSKTNYIGSNARNAYAQAFLREYKRYTGEPVEEDAPLTLEIKVLGEGCTRCHKLTADVMSVLSETGIDGDLEHVTDIKEIAKYGVMGTPALVINGKVVAVGKIPSAADITAWLKTAVTAMQSQ